MNTYYGTDEVLILKNIKNFNYKIHKHCKNVFQLPKLIISNLILFFIFLKRNYISQSHILFLSQTRLKLIISKL